MAEMREVPRGYWWARHAPDWAWEWWLARALEAEARAHEEDSTPTTASGIYVKTVMADAPAPARTQLTAAEAEVLRRRWREKRDAAAGASSIPDGTFSIEWADSGRALFSNGITPDSTTGPEGRIGYSRVDEFMHADDIARCARPGCHATAILDEDRNIIEWVEVLGDRAHVHRIRDVSRVDPRTGIPVKNETR